MQATTSAPSFWLRWSYGVQKTACYTGPPLPPVLTVFLFSLHCLSLWVCDIRGTVCDQESHRHLLSSRWQAVISVSTATHSTEKLKGWGLLKSTSFNWFFLDHLCLKWFSIWLSGSCDTLWMIIFSLLSLSLFLFLTFLLDYGWDCQGTTLSPSLYGWGCRGTTISPSLYLQKKSVIAL